MAGLIARLFGGKPSPAADTEPAPGIGGYHLGRGPAGQTGFPGSTSQVRTFPGRNPVRLGAGNWTGIKAETNDGAFHVSVRDTGPGISAADQAKLFQEFQQADNAIT